MAEQAPGAAEGLLLGIRSSDEKIRTGVRPKPTKLHRKGTEIDLDCLHLKTGAGLSAYLAEMLKEKKSQFTWNQITKENQKPSSKALPAARPGIVLTLVA